MRHIKVNPRQVEILETYCEVTGRNLDDLIEQILFDWSIATGMTEMEAFTDASTFRVPARIIVMPDRGESFCEGRRNEQS